MIYNESNKAVNATALFAGYLVERVVFSERYAVNPLYEIKILLAT